MVAWALTITDLDPLRFGLLFERFLNPERISMPDFDIDFCEDRRDEVISHVQEEYGRDQVAQIITFGTLRARAALRDVGRVLEMPYGQVDRICKMVPNNPADPVTLGQAIKSEKAIREARDEDEAVARLLTIALKLEGLYRHASTHAAGRHAANASALEEAIQEQGGESMIVELDLVSSDSISEAFAQIREQAGDPDVLVYNAGYLEGRDLPPEKELLEHAPGVPFPGKIAIAERETSVLFNSRENPPPARQPLHQTRQINLVTHRHVKGDGSGKPT